MIIRVPVSIGEAIDKLTILDIKLEKINDKRRSDVEKEYNILYDNLKEIIEKFRYFYRILKNVNLEIWELQDKLRDDKKLSGTEYHQICIKIIEENDRRFRVKKKINRLSESELKEQKGYKKRKVYIMPHFGYGDTINMIGAIRYYSTKYDEVLVACEDYKQKNLKMFFRDDPDIKLLTPTYGEANIKKTHGVEKIYICGYHKPNSTPINSNNVPDCFYQDLEIAPQIRVSYFYFQETKESQELYNLVKETNKKYIFIHDKSSNAVLDFNYLKKERPEYLLINCSRNMYQKDDGYYELCQKLVNQLIIHYSKIIENASELYLIDSCMLCFTNHLDLSGVEKKTIYTRWGRDYPTYLQDGFEVVHT